MLKGEVKALPEVTDIAPVLFMDTPLKDRWGYEVPQKAILRGVQDRPEYANHVTVDALCPVPTAPETFNVRQFILPNTVQVKVLTGTAGKTLLKQQQEYAAKHLAAVLGYSKPNLGADPEIFVTDENGQVIPAFEFLPSEKEAGKTPSWCGFGGDFKDPFWDGYQAEFNTVAKRGFCIAWIADDTRTQLMRILKAAQKVNKKAKLSTKTVIDVPYELRMKAAPEHVALGCAPSLNAYDIRPQIPDGHELPFRSVGGHIHFGIKLTPKQAVEVVKALDATLGIAGVSMFAMFDDAVRRNFYGTAGEYRMPEHGLEYRVLSNAWIFHPGILHLTLDFARQCHGFGFKGLRPAINEPEDKIREIINTCDVTAARKYIAKHRKVFECLLTAAYGDQKRVTPAMKVMENGMEVAVADPHDIPKNWHFDGHWAHHSESDNCQWRTLSATVARGGKA